MKPLHDGLDCGGGNMKFRNIIILGHMPWVRKRLPWASGIKNVCLLSHGDLGTAIVDIIWDNINYEALA